MSRQAISDVQITAQHGLQQIVPIHLTDQGTGILVGRDVGGVFGQDIAHQLIDGVIAFFLECVVHLLHDFMDLDVLLIVDGKNGSSVAHEIHPLK